MTRNNKGVSPIIATMLMVIVAVAAGALVLALISSNVISADSTKESNRILEDLKVVQVTVGEDKTVHVFVINRGNVTSTVDRLYIKDYEGNLVAVINVSKPVGVNEVKDFIIDAAGMDVWRWYEITGVTELGNKILSKVSGNPFTNDAFPPPGPNEHEYVFRVSKITVNGEPVTDPSIFNSLLAIDGDTYAIPSKACFLGYNDSVAAIYYDLKGETLEGPKSAGIDALFYYADGKYLHVVTNKLPDSSFSSTVFNGSVQNPEYDRFTLNFSVDLQNGNFPVNFTVEFFNWATRSYSSSGNGYWAALNLSNKDYAGKYNFSIPMAMDSLVSESGNWSLRINVSAGTTGNINIKYDYLKLILGQRYSNGIETLLYYNVSQHVKYPENVTNMIFSVTGTFPKEASFWFNAFNYSRSNPAEKHWQILGVINGSESSWTWIFTVSGSNCADFIDENGIVIIRIFPVEDLPTGTTLQLDQAKLLITVKEAT